MFDRSFINVLPYTYTRRFSLGSQRAFTSVLVLISIAQPGLLEAIPTGYQDS